MELIPSDDPRPAFEQWSPSQGFVLKANTEGFSLVAYIFR
jgi:hypothetical protein